MVLKHHTHLVRQPTLSLIFSGLPKIILTSFLDFFVSHILGLFCLNGPKQYTILKYANDL